MPEWMMLPDALDPKIAVFVLLIAVVLSLSYFGRKDDPRAKAGVAAGSSIASSVLPVNGGASRAAADTTGSDS